MVLVTLAGTLPIHVVCIATFLILDSSSMDNTGRENVSVLYAVHVLLLVTFSFKRK